jgi:hypothetical protein
LRAIRHGRARRLGLLRAFPRTGIAFAGTVRAHDILPVAVHSAPLAPLLSDDGTTSLACNILPIGVARTIEPRSRASTTVASTRLLFVPGIRRSEAIYDSSSLKIDNFFKLDSLHFRQSSERKLPMKSH